MSILPVALILLFPFYKPTNVYAYDPRESTVTVIAAYGDTSKLKRKADAPLFSNYEYSLKAGEDPARKINDNIFIKVTTNKSEYYQNETVIVKYRLYSRLVDESVVSQYPLNTNFYSLRVKQSFDTEEGIETIQGKTYKVKTLHKALLIPFTTGKIPLNPLFLNSSIQFTRELAGDSKGNSLDELMNRIEKEENLPKVVQKVELTSRPAIINVLVLPLSNKPVSFGGTVGSFKLTDSLTSNQMPVGEMNSLILTLRGNGYSPLSDTPKISWPPGFEIEKVQISETYEEGALNVKAEKKITFSFSARNEGEYQLPSVSFAYFDPVAGTYKQIYTRPYQLHVKGSTSKSSIDAADSSLYPKNGRSSIVGFIKSNSFPLGVLVGVSILLITFAAVRYRNKEIKRIQLQLELQQLEKEKEVRRFHLTKAQQYYDDKNYPDYFLELERVLLAALSEKFNIPMELNKTDLPGILAKNNYSSLTPEVLDILNGCETSLYMPNSIVPNSHHLLKQAEKIISLLFPVVNERH